MGRAIRYSLEGAGKRLRPALVFAAHEALGGQGDPAPFAVAVEVVHTYSLVHDDLPCMDDDDLRRGRPTTHCVFGAAVATEAGFRMVPLAARIIAVGGREQGLDVERVGRMAATLFRAAGVSGMIGGQMLDLEAEGRETDLDGLGEIHRRKTGALIAASVEIGALAAGATGGALAAVAAYGREIGLAFQIVDDVLDATASSHELGKTAGKDRAQGKATFAALLGPERALAAAREHAECAMDHLGDGAVDSTLLTGLAHFIVNRRS